MKIPNEARILIVDDSEISVVITQTLLAKIGYQVVGRAASGEEAILISKELQPDLILMDIQLLGAMDGIETAQILRTQFQLPVVFLTATAAENNFDRAKLAEPLGYLLKPFSERELQAVIEMALYKHQAEAALLVSNKRFHDLVDSSDGIVWEADADTFLFHYVSSNAERVLGYPVSEWLQPGFWVEHLYVEDRDLAVQTCLLATQRQEQHDFEYRFVARDGRLVWLRDIVKVVVENGTPRWLRGLMLDITAQKEAAAVLKASLQEKEVLLQEKEALLREVHHRVKNNLQVISSLLRLEFRRSKQPESQSVLSDMQNRIQALATLHEVLYRSGSFAVVDLSVYLKQVLNKLWQTIVPEGSSVELRLDLERMLVQLEQVTPCGMIVNELVSNCLKHAFPDGRGGEVRLELKTLEAGAGCFLRVSDTGVGLPANFESLRTQSLGLQLVSDLAGQLGGRLERGSGPGTEFTVTFGLQRSELPVRSA